MKILLVEDELEKKRLIIEAILEVEGLALDNIHSVDDAYSAKRSLTSHKYDLLILDINVPARSDQHTEVGGGLDVVGFIRNNDKAIHPSYVIGMSAYDDGMAAASPEFVSPIWRLVRFSYESMSWKEPLKQALSYLIKQEVPPYINDGSTFRSDLGIVVALEDQEMKSIKDLDAHWKDLVIAHDFSRYLRGSFEGDGVSLDVIAVSAPRMGMPSAAVTATKLIYTFRPRYLAISGICAGIRGKVNIGDILIADPCFDWGSGKWIRDKTTHNLKFRPAPYPWRLNEDLRSGIRSVADSPGLLRSIYDSYQGPKPALPPNVFVDAMASGGSVVQATELMDDITDQHKNLIGVEMESYAVFTAAEYSSRPRPQCIAVKSVCDFGGDDKDDDFHAYAAFTSAQFLFEFARRRLCSVTI